MIETLLGSLFGGVFRMAPEILKWLDRKDERKHEITMFDLQLRADAQKGQLALDQVKVQTEGATSAAELQALIEATKAQAEHTGIGWVDAMNSLMRPVITFWWGIVLYTAVLAAEYIVLREGGAAYTQAILQLWGPDEKAIVASIFAFWFVDRSLRKGFNK